MLSKEYLVNASSKFVKNLFGSSSALDGRTPNRLETSMEASTEAPLEKIHSRSRWASVAAPTPVLEESVVACVEYSAFVSAETYFSVEMFTDESTVKNSAEIVEAPTICMDACITSAEAFVKIRRKSII